MIFFSNVGDVLSRMPYTDAIIKEAMRLRWVVGMVWRNACRDFELEGYRIPEGHRIICSMASAAESIPGSSGWRPIDLLIATGVFLSWTIVIDSMQECCKNAFVHFRHAAQNVLM